MDTARPPPAIVRVRTTAPARGIPHPRAGPSERARQMPFTLSHPAAVLPLLRGPFVPAALVAGAMAPDVPYFLRALGLAATNSRQWHEPFLNATQTHSPGGALTVTLPFAIALVAGYRLLRRPLNALLPAGYGLPGPAAPSGAKERAIRAVWLLLSALIGIATHQLWDAFTHHHGFLVERVPLLRAPAVGGLSVARLVQYASTAAGLALIGRHLWNHRGRLRSPGAAGGRLTPAVRWTVVAAIVLATAVGAAAHTRGGLDAHRHTTEVDYSRPIVREDDGFVDTSYPTRTVEAPWGTVAEGVLSDAARGAGGAFTAGLALYAALWWLRRAGAGAGRAPSAPEHALPPRTGQVR
ncbi:DUF4184 family protein [Streptomyces yaizuensis]|nr:DUF4184 family protein [Streptomyces sp. YSPA8]